MSVPAPFRRVATFLVILALAGHATRGHADPPTERPSRRALLVTGVDYPGHPWRETAPVIRDILETGGSLEVRVVEDHEFLASDVIFDYDLIVLNMKNYDPVRRAEALRAHLERFVREGRGLVALHFTCGAFEDWPDFKELVGRVWDKSLRGHDPRGPFTVQITDSDHPITRGMVDFETDDELYTCLGADGPEIHLLATARSKVDGQDYPIAFTLAVGQGRVFHTVLGHDARALTWPGPAELIRRGCVWASGADNDD